MIATHFLIVVRSPTRFFEEHMASKLTSATLLQLAERAGARAFGLQSESVMLTQASGLDRVIPHSYCGSPSNKPFGWSRGTQ